MDNMRKYLIGSTALALKMAIYSADVIHAQSEKVLDLMMGASVGFQSHVGRVVKDWFRVSKGMMERYREVVERVLDGSLKVD